MQRKPPSKARAGTGSRAAQPEQRVNRIADVPVEFREMLADNIRSSRQNNTPSTSATAAESTPKRKKPLTRDRRPPASKPEVVAEEPKASTSSSATKRKRETPAQPSTPDPVWPTKMEETYTSPLAQPLSAKKTGQGRPAVVQEPESDSESEDYDEEDDDDDEADWETVDLSTLKTKPQAKTRSDEPIVFEISSSKVQVKSKKTGRTGPTPAERKIRLEVHKMHLLCLLSHVHRRSHYCNDSKVQDALFPILERRVIAELNDNSFQQTKIFKQGLSNAAAAFRRRFRITRPGVRKALWGNIPSSPSALYGDVPMGIEEFRDAAKKLAGSRDLAAQLFCALIRRAGLDARLVCSLQTLSYLFKAKYSIEDSKRSSMKLIEEDANDYRTSDEDSGTDGFVGNVNKSFGGPGPMNFRAAPVAPSRTGGLDMGLPKQKKKQEKQIRIHDPALPVYWVEVFDVMSQSWVAVDPMGLGVVRNFNNFEPPHSDAWENEMSYVVAFDKHNKVRDITRKYVKSYNAYTRTLRVEATLDGKKWWRKALKPFTVPVYMIPDRDQFENGLMDDMLLREGIPKSLTAMKNHPVFAIEEQLRQDEVIHPKKECGKMIGKNKKAIPVYRRQDVKRVKTATQWYMLGREIKAGEQPLKRKKLKRRRVRDLDDIDPEEAAEMEEEDAGMYAEYQTMIYQAEPCLGQMVPKNAFGNIDLYVPSMLPEGGVHIPHKFARAAANALGIGDFVADAVTGFDFRTSGRSTPIVRGIVAAEESEEAIWAMIDHLEREEEEEVVEKRRILSLNLWRKFLVGLRIKERVDDYAQDDEEPPARITDEDENDDDIADSPTSDNYEPAGSENGGFLRDEPDNTGNEGGGGFFTTDLEELAGNAMRNEAQRKESERLAAELEKARSRYSKMSEMNLYTGEEDLYDPNVMEGGGGFFVDEPPPMSDDNSVADDTTGSSKRKLNETAFDGGGGFFPEDAVLEDRPRKRSRTSTPVPTSVEDYDVGGGFLVEEEEQQAIPEPIPIKNSKRKIGEEADGDQRPRKRSRSASPSLNDSIDPTPPEFKQEQAAKKAERESQRESQKEEALRMEDRIAKQLAKGEDVEIPDNLVEDDVLSDDFEFEDAGWASD